MPRKQTLRKKASRYLSGISTTLNRNLTASYYADYLRSISHGDNGVEILLLCKKFLVASALLEKRYNRDAIKELMVELEGKVGKLKYGSASSLFSSSHRSEKNVKQNDVNKNDISDKKMGKAVTVKNDETTVLALRERDITVGADVSALPSRIQHQTSQQKEGNVALLQRDQLSDEKDMQGSAQDDSSENLVITIDRVKDDAGCSSSDSVKAVEVGETKATDKFVVEADSAQPDGPLPKQNSSAQNASGQENADDKEKSVAQSLQSSTSIVGNASSLFCSFPSAGQAEIGGSVEEDGEDEEDGFYFVTANDWKM